MIGKVKYLINCLDVKESEILCISFTNFTTDSLKKSLEKQKIFNVDVLTFHKLGMKIIKEKGETINICSDNLLDSIIKSFFNNDLLKNRKLLNSFINEYIIKNNICLDDLNICNDEEIIISNFLYFYNIKYSYKCIGFYKKYIYAFYLEDYDLYIKHYNLDTNTLDDIENIREMLNKNVLETYTQMFKEGTIIDELTPFLKNNNVKLNKKKEEEIYEIFKLKGKKIDNLSKTIYTFINMFKSNNFSFDKFDDITKKLKKDQKLLTILEIIKNIYILYQVNLKNNNQIDFNDMINLATNIIKKMDVFLKYKYIIIDEYQDTSYGRYELLKAIKEQGNSKLIAVGDDFQSIYRFTGCDVNMFINFTKYFPFSKILYLTSTYRNSSELIKLAGDFIMKNKYQIKKKLKSSKRLKKPIKIYLYKNTKEIANLFQKINEKNLFVLGRNNNDINIFNINPFIIESDNIIYKDKNIKFMSVHKSKGLENDAVVIVNLEDKMLGFPSKCEDDILISYLNNFKVYYPYDEERRLFYVALTRTKGNVYLFVPIKNKSIFVSEIIKENRNLIEFIN